MPRSTRWSTTSTLPQVDRPRLRLHLAGRQQRLKLKDALIRAAEARRDSSRLADALGSRLFIRSQPLARAARRRRRGAVALPVGNPLWTLIRGRVDLRNHRKLMIVDNRIAWCGSQNVADPEFRIKPRYAPWVDIMSRWEGRWRGTANICSCPTGSPRAATTSALLLTSPGRPTSAATMRHRAGDRHGPDRPDSMRCRPAFPS